MNTFGHHFRVSVFGESHGPLVGVLIDGCPPGIPLDAEMLKEDLQRRKSGAPGTTARKESDHPELLSGVYNGYTTGTPVLITTANRDRRPEDYKQLQNIARPGHADFTASRKYKGYNDPRGGGHFSGRLTFGLVAAGTLARHIINPVQVEAQLTEAGGRKDIKAAVQQAVEEKDSIGGWVKCVCTGVPAGWGEPYFFSAESAISQIVFAIPAIKGISFGSGFQAARMKGSEHNDAFVSGEGRTATNHAGGINGGITNGNELILEVAVKPASSIAKEQQTFHFNEKKMTRLAIEGRHDACIALRVPVVLESAVAIALADLKQTHQSLFNHE